MAIALYEVLKDANVVREVVARKTVHPIVGVLQRRWLAQASVFAMATANRIRTITEILILDTRELQLGFGVIFSASIH